MPDCEGATGEVRATTYDERWLRLDHATAPAGPQITLLIPCFRISAKARSYAQTGSGYIASA
jgi:hypothetical protein